MRGGLRADWERRKQEERRRREEVKQKQATEQAERAAARLAASADRKRQPTTGWTEEDSRGGECDLRWRQGKGGWVRTEATWLGWVLEKPRTTVVAAKPANSVDEGVPFYRRSVTLNL